RCLILDPALYELAKNALRAKEEDEEEDEIQQAGGNRVRNVGRHDDLKDRDQHGADHPPGDHAPPANDDGHIRINTEWNSPSRVDEELISEKRAGDAGEGGAGAECAGDHYRGANANSLRHLPVLCCST